jgi:hypothetical protein
LTSSATECLSILVFDPAGLGIHDVFALPLLGAAAEQDDEHLAVPSEVNSIAGSEIHFQLGHTAADAFHVRAITLRKSVQGNADLRLGLLVERIEPKLKRRAAVAVDE